MKILHVIPSYKPAYIYGGPIESVASLCEASFEAGNDVSVFTTTANGNVELDVEPGKEINVNNVRVTYFSRLTKGHTHISPSLWSQLYSECDKYDVVHIHSWWNPLVVVSAMICHAKNAHVIISPRGMLSHYIMTKTHGTTKKCIHKLIGEKTLKRSTFHATSESEYIECKNLIKGWNGFLLPNIINLPINRYPRSNNNLFTLIFLSRIHPKKGIEFIFEALSQLGTPVRLRIAGTGEESYIQELKEKSVKLKVDHLIDWVGWKGSEEKYIELANADLFILTSHNENFANVVIESLYVGTPVLITENIGLSNFVKDHNLGWISQLNTESILKQLQLAISNKEKRNFINSNASKEIMDNFSKEVIIDKYLENYHHLKFGDNLILDTNILQ